MNAQEQYDAFVADIRASTSKFTESRSSLKNLLTNLRTQIGNQKKTGVQPTTFLNVEAAKRLCKAPADSRLAKYEPALRRLVRCWGTLNDYPPRPVSAESLINAVRDELNQCKDFACNDATTFSGDINPKANKTAILEKARASGAMVALPIAASDTYAWNASHLRLAKESVYKNRSGECTNFGKAAAHVLATAAISGPRPRIELVAWEVRKESTAPRTGASAFTPVIVVAHVYCVVNREGGTTEVTVGRKRKRQLPAIDTWGDDCWVVDPWLASLGWESCYRLADYPKKGFLSPVYLEMDSTGGG